MSTVAVNEKGYRIGQDHHNAKCTDRDIELGYQLREQGLSYRKIAALLEISHTHVMYFLTGKKRCQIPHRYVSK